MLLYNIIELVSRVSLNVLHYYIYTIWNGYNTDIINLLCFLYSYASVLKQLQSCLGFLLWWRLFAFWWWSEKQNTKY